MTHVVICGAGFAGLELSTLLAERFPDDVRITLIDAGDAFVFGFSKLDVLFGRSSADAVRHRYSDIAKPSVTFRQERITAIDPQARRVTTDRGTHDADILVIALGADYAPEATPGLAEGGYEFYSLAGAQRAADVIPTIDEGRIVIGICGPFFKCPPAPFETALLLDDHLRSRGVRDDVTITLVSPLPMAIPVSAPTSEAIARALDDRGIRAVFNELVVELDVDAKVARYKSNGAIDYDLFLGIPKHVAPAVVAESGLLTDGWIDVDARHLTTRFEDVYAVGDITNAPSPRAGVFAERQAQAAFAHIAAKLTGSGDTPPYDGKGICYLEFGGGEVAKVDADFLSEPSPRADLVGPSRALAAEKERFGTDRRARWFS